MSEVLETVGYIQAHLEVWRDKVEKLMEDENYPLPVDTMVMLYTLVKLLKASEDVIDDYTFQNALE